MNAPSEILDVIRLVENSDLFDATWYAAQYPDVTLMAMNAAEHYVRIGRRLLRDPSAQFSTRYYLAMNPDIASAAIDPFIHYITFGRDEGRVPRPPDGAPIDQVAAPGAIVPTPPPPVAPRLRFDEEQEAAIQREFDSEFYCSRYPLPPGVDPYEYFMQQGWRQGHDPSVEFSTEYYLQQSPDIAGAGINPFAHYVLHGRAEKRPALPYLRLLTQGEFVPKVSVIVPNFNHGRFLAQRIDSILEQTYQNFDLLILDDCSSDDSREVIADYCQRFPDKVRSILNSKNAGNVFRQWRKGVENVDGELVWICESDDFCERSFLEQIVRSFRDRSVKIAFGRIQFCNRYGQFQEGLDQYREGAEPGIWAETLVRPASTWFTGGFGVNNVIANVGGCVWRRQILPDAIWNEAETYRILGDWFLYCHLASGGQIAYEPAAIAYFRQHGGNTSVKSFLTPGYYVEHQRLMSLLKQRWEIPDVTVEKFLGNITFQYQHFKVADEHGEMSRYVDRQALFDQRRSQPHILIGFLGFYPGGGEFFPLHLANALHAQGCLVSMLAYTSVDQNQEMIELLNPAIAVYDAAWVREMGVDEFLKRTGTSLVHSHMVNCESVFFTSDRPSRLPVPYLVTLHGSYDACGVSAENVARYAAGVQHWIYTTERNLQPFTGLPLPPDRFSQMPNGMPVDPRPFPKTRAELGIDADAVVFTLVARGILRKGWRATIEAFVRLRKLRPENKMHLLLCGDGELVERHQAVHEADPDMTFLGFQTCISGLYRISDCAIAPTRFAGESFPLCLIQAMQVGTPIIATRTGEIEAMTTQDDLAAGILIDPVRDTQVFIEELVQAMDQMLSPTLRLELTQAALVIGERYDLDQVAHNYREVYSRLLSDTSTLSPERQ